MTKLKTNETKYFTDCGYNYNFDELDSMSWKLRTGLNYKPEDNLYLLSDKMVFCTDHEDSANDITCSKYFFGEILENISKCLNKNDDIGQHKNYTTFIRSDENDNYNLYIYCLLNLKDIQLQKLKDVLDHLSDVEYSKSCLKFELMDKPLNTLYDMDRNDCIYVEPILDENQLSKKLKHLVEKYGHTSWTPNFNSDLLNNSIVSIYPNKPVQQII